MDNNFKNPFQIDEENLEMISLAGHKEATQSISSRQTFLNSEKNND